MAGGGGGEEEVNLEFTPTWVVAVVCSVIVFISLCVERLLHFLGKFLKKKGQKPLYEALLKIKEELMLLGFISLLLTVLQGAIQNICVANGAYDHMLPCKKEEEHDTTTTTSSRYQVGRRLLSGGRSSGHCATKGKIPLLSIEALHQLHIFIFVLAISHVTFCALTMILGSLRIREWKHWEDSVVKEIDNPIREWKHWEDSVVKEIDNPESNPNKVTHIHQFEFIQKRFKGIENDSFVICWLHSFGKQFYGSVTKSDYTTMRLGFIMTHCPGNQKFNFHRYMIRALEADFKKVVGISWYLWIFVVIFLLLNVSGWHMYFWIAFIPLMLLLAVGTKLEHVISQLAHDVAEKHSAIEGDLVVKPSDDHFWFRRPRIVLYLIHFILFQNAFEIAFFFWIWSAYGFDSCIMGRVVYIVPRLVIGVIIQVLCSYSTLPLYAVVTQMGTSFKKAIFDEHVQTGLVGWARNVKQRKGMKSAAAINKPLLSTRPPRDIAMQHMGVETTSGTEGGIMTVELNESKPTS